MSKTIKLRNPKFKIGQLVQFPSNGNPTHRSRKTGIIIGIERAYELQDNYKRYTPDGTCRGELTTIKDETSDSFGDIQKRERELVDELTKKYGQGTLDPQSGVFTPSSTDSTPQTTNS